MSGIVADAKLNAAQVAAIRELAARSGRPVTQIVRQLVDVGLFVLTGQLADGPDRRVSASR